MMMVCTGQGDPDTGHCCIIAGKVCPLLFVNEGGIPRCSVWGKWDKSPYLESAAAAYYEQKWPGMGYTCQDWPQNIPDVMNTPETGKCCFG